MEKAEPGTERVCTTFFHCNPAAIICSKSNEFADAAEGAGAEDVKQAWIGA